MICKSGALLAVLVALLSGPVWAHHSISAVFPLSETGTVTGTLKKVDFRNPHIEVFLETVGVDGEVETWVIEGGAPRDFLRNEISKSDFEGALGQTVTIEALPAKGGELRDFLLAFTFPDGTSWSRPRPQ